ncbi:MAG TPA: zinc metalloprotease HtpX [Bryobacteraceae bacterium]|jgi:heat shock protein HtpX|nr:zinc metalloprotease HtpX [Bryobacteraceae bacterium]
MHHGNNALKTVALLGLLSAILIVGGRAIAGDQGIYYGVVIAVVMNFASYFFSDKLALAMSGAQPLTPESAPGIYARIAPLVENIARRMNIPMPKLYITPEPSPNAFATGRDPKHSSIAFTAGILQLMSDSELEGVVAHELGHVLHRDILISSVAATIAAAITALSRMAFWFGGGRRDDRDGGSGWETLAMLILGPIAAMLIQMAISRTREYDADAASAKYIGSPYPLINALEKLDGYAKRIPMEADPATSHLYIMKPLGGGGMMRLFSTHPSTEDRVRRLQQMR